MTRPLYRMIEIYEHIIEKHQKEILFIPTVIPYDRELAKQIKVCIKYPQHFHYLKYDYKPTVLMGIIGRSQWMLAMRLHSMIFATIMNIPFFAIVYDQKVSNFLKITKNKYYCDMNDLDSNVIFSRLNTFVNKQDLMKDSLRGIYNRLYHILERFNYDEI